MKTCPMCQQWHAGAVTVCRYCGYAEKPVEEYTKSQLFKLMQHYEYEKTEDGGYRIHKVLNERSMAFRDTVGLPHFVTEIDDGAFAYCKFITEIELHNGIKAIGSNSFAHCKGLEYVFVPESVAYMGKGVFDNCHGLRIHCAAWEKPEGWDEGWLDGCDANVKWNCSK